MNIEEGETYYHDEGLLVQVTSKQEDTNQLKILKTYDNDRYEPEQVITRPAGYPQKFLETTTEEEVTPMPVQQGDSYFEWDGNGNPPKREGTVLDVLERRKVPGGIWQKVKVYWRSL